MSLCPRTWWRVTWCMLFVRRWRSWRSRSRSWLSATPSWSRKTTFWRHWPARSRWPSSRPRFRLAPHLPLQQVPHRYPQALQPLPSPPRTALAPRHSRHGLSRQTDSFWVLQQLQSQTMPSKAGVYAVKTRICTYLSLRRMQPAGQVALCSLAHWRVTILNCSMARSKEDELLNICQITLGHIN